jgi:hypothetical protein
MVTLKRLKSIYRGMKRRCCNPKDPSHKNYGGRGIAICDEWVNDFWAFSKWAVNNGYSDDLTIERIDNDKGYSPENCVWADRSWQALNRRTNHYITYKGHTNCISTWARLYGLPETVLHGRIQRGWDFEKAIKTPYYPYRKKYK